MNLSTRKSFLVAVALGAFALVGGTGLTVSSAWLITMASAHPPVLVLSVAIVMVRFFGIFRSVARYGERVISHEAIFKKLTGVRVALFTAIASRINSGSPAIAQESKAIIDDVERAQEFHLRVTLPGLYATFATIATVAIADWIGQFLFLWVAALTLFFAIGIPLLVRNLLDPLAGEIEDSEGELAQELADASHAMVEAEVFGYRTIFQERVNATVEKVERLERKNFTRTSLLQLSTILAIGVTLVGTSISLFKSDSLPAIQVSMSIFLILVGFEGFTSWYPNLFPAGKNRRASERVTALSKIDLRNPSSSEIPLSYEIKAVNLTPFWREKFLSPISFTCQTGETLIIEGASGVGKSTLAATFLGFASYSGSLTVGGVEISKIADRSVLISASLQESHIFNTTLRENLKIARADLLDSEALKVLRALELESIDLDEVLGEFGRNLSGGEAKRLAVARAILSRAPIIILDEPLEHLDYERAQRIQRAIAELTAGRTLIVITHSPWLQYDRKVILERE